MEYTKQLINKAKGKRCNICLEYITESGADNCEFQYTQTSGRREVFVHTKCWINDCKK